MNRFELNKNVFRRFSRLQDRQPDENLASSMEVKEHFDSDISVLLQDKQRLQEQLESAQLCCRQMEEDLRNEKENFRGKSSKKISICLLVF